MNDQAADNHDAPPEGPGKPAGNDVVVSVIRTYVPIIVGAIAAWLATRGFSLDQESQSLLIVALTGGCVAGYYTLVRLLEQRWPGLGLLLGTTRQPNYRPTPTSPRPRKTRTARKPRAAPKAKTPRKPQKPAK